MVKIREKQTQKLEAAAAKSSKFTGIKNMSTPSKISLVLLVLVALSAILAPVIAPHNPLEITQAYQPPSADHIFGTDNTGRDILSRMLYGGQYSLIIGFGATLFALEKIGRPLPGAAMLAGFAALTGMLRLESVQAAYAVKFSGKVAEANADIARLAWDYVKAQLGENHA